MSDCNSMVKSPRSSGRSSTSSPPRSPSESSLSSSASDSSDEEYTEQTRRRTRRRTSSTSSNDSETRSTVYYVINEGGERVHLDERIFEDAFNTQAIRKFCAKYNDEPTDEQITVLADMLEMEFDQIKTAVYATITDQLKIERAENRHQRENLNDSNELREYKKDMKDWFVKHQWWSEKERTRFRMIMGYKEGKMKADFQKKRKAAMDAFLTKNRDLPWQMKILMGYEEKYNKITKKKKLIKLKKQLSLKAGVHGAQVASFMKLAKDRKTKFERKLKKAAREREIDTDFEMEENNHEGNDEIVRDEENGNDDDM